MLSTQLFITKGKIRYESRTCDTKPWWPRGNESLSVTDPAGDPGWYFSIHEDGVLSSPYTTKEKASEAGAETYDLPPW